MFDLNSDEEEIDLAHDDVFQMVFAFVVLEFDVKAVLNSHFHFDARREKEREKD